VPGPGGVKTKLGDLNDSRQEEEISLTITHEYGQGRGVGWWKTESRYCHQPTKRCRKRKREALLHRPCSHPVPLQGRFLRTDQPTSRVESRAGTVLSSHSIGSELFLRTGVMDMRLALVKMTT
jgi:hypothetical protein